jgi:hypothetical protein
MRKLLVGWLVLLSAYPSVTPLVAQTSQPSTTEYSSDVRPVNTDYNNIGTSHFSDNAYNKALEKESQRQVDREQRLQQLQRKASTAEELGVKPYWQKEPNATGEPVEQLTDDERLEWLRQSMEARTNEQNRQFAEEQVVRAEREAKRAEWAEKKALQAKRDKEREMLWAQQQAQQAYDKKEKERSTLLRWSTVLISVLAFVIIRIRQKMRPPKGYL